MACFSLDIGSVLNSAFILVSKNSISFYILWQYISLQENDFVLSNSKNKKSRINYNFPFILRLLWIDLTNTFLFVYNPLSLLAKMECGGYITWEIIMKKVKNIWEGKLRLNYG